MPLLFSGFFFSTLFIAAGKVRPLEVKIAAPHYPLNAGSRKQIICETTGSRPRAILSWWLDGKKIGAGTTDTVSDGGNLTVSTLHLVPTPNDDGKILSCRAENPAVPNSAIEDEWTIRVHYAPIISLALGASISPSNIKEGSDVYLECNIRANPWVSDVTWQFEDHYVVSNKSAGIIISNQTLVLQSVRREHRGRYRCLAGNSEGQSVSDYLHLLVQYAPVCKLSDPKVYGVARAEVVNVTCEVEADPPDVNFRWALNNTLEVVNLQKWWSEGSRSVLSYTPRTLAGYGLLLCWGNNVIGGQREPCVAKIIPAGKIEKVESEVRRKIEGIEEKIEVSKGEAQEKIGNLERRISELENRQNNFQTSPELMYVRSTVKYLRFDGQTSWADFKTQVNVISSTNGWTDLIKTSQLVASLRGSAAEVHQGIPPEKLTDLVTIENALESKFVDSHLTQFYRTELKTRRQKPGESLRILAADVERLMSLVYADYPLDVLC
ncbi:hypothetical protein AVEN_121380-1 [Araneus ventricosus]|uniref:Ig-like domain-containing protein n=1 Tax=Araneus ventricosus TaxID=182803 RepID=A0A4Y2CRB9_ARAVE|nr:hypothetical protein AVEN_121380-1 [Araneus ventricosus]